MPQPPLAPMRAPRLPVIDKCFAPDLGVGYAKGVTVDGSFQPLIATLLYSERALAAYSARVVKYGELIRGARGLYREYTEGGRGVPRVHDIIVRIGEGDRWLMRPL